MCSGEILHAVLHEAIAANLRKSLIRGTFPAIALSRCQVQVICHCSIHFPYIITEHQNLIFIFLIK